MPTFSKPPTAIVMLNLGGPANQEGVEPFLLQLFADRETIQLPFQDQLGPFIARRRAPKARARYAAIGGGSPLLDWTNRQGAEMVRRLDLLAPDSAPHQFYPAFRHAPPFAADALRQMKADGVQRAVAFSQYPQFSCATSGSSLNELWRVLHALGYHDAFTWSVIDRWPVHPGFIAALAHSVQQGLLAFDETERDAVVLVFSAHSLPLSVIARGDTYPQEVGASVQAVMQQLQIANPYLLSYQSSVGPVKWLGPSSEAILRQLGQHKQRQVLMVPVAFTSDHIETLHEIDIEFQQVAQASGITHFRRAPALNDGELFVNALADLVAAHLRDKVVCSSQFRLPCPGCTNPDCRVIPNPIFVNSL